MAYGARALTDGDFGEAAELLGAAFGGWPGYGIGDVHPADHLRWKLEGPDREPCQTAAVSGGRIVGLYLTIPRRVCVGGERLLLVDSVDNVVHASARGRGVYRRMIEHAEGHREGAYDGAWGNYSVSGTVMHVFPRNADNTLHKPIRLAQKVYSPLRMVREGLAGGGGLPSMGSLLAGVGGVLRGALPRRAPGMPELPPRAIRDIDRFDESADELWLEASRGLDLAVERSAEYLNWRYLDPRSPRYRARGWIEDGRLFGFAVTCKAGPIGYLADVWAVSDRRDVTSGLLNDGLDHLVRDGAALVRTWTVEGDGLWSELRERGFDLLDSAPVMHFETWSAAGDALARVTEPGARVHSALGDSDLV